jgi:hypothetical protein
MLLKDMPDHGRLIIDKHKLNFFKCDDTNKKEMARKTERTIIDCSNATRADLFFFFNT